MIVVDYEGLSASFEKRRELVSCPVARSAMKRQHDALLTKAFDRWFAEWSDTELFVEEANGILPAELRDQIWKAVEARKSRR